jgi:hypothetical protein
VILGLRELALGPFAVDTWTLLGRVPIAVALGSLALLVARGAGWRRGALALSGFAAGAAAGVALLPSILGAFAGGLFVGGLSLRALGARPPPATRVAAALLWILALGRVGCLLNGCCFGLPTALPWGVAQPAGFLAAHLHEGLGLVAEGAPSAPLHPVQGYEALGSLAFIAALPWLRRRLRSDGAAALLAAAGYLALFAALDPLRAMVNTAWSVRWAGPLSVFQWGAFAAASVLAALAFRRSRPDRVAPSPRPGAEAEPGIAALGAVWSAQALLAFVALAWMTPFLVLLTTGSLALAGALLLPVVVAGTEGRTSRRRVALALACALIIPFGIRAGSGERSERRWIYAPWLAQGAPQPGAPAEAPEAPEGVPVERPEAGENPDGSDADGTSGEAQEARLVRIGDQRASEEELARRAAALRFPRNTVKLRVAGFGIRQQVEDAEPYACAEGSSCAGGACVYGMTTTETKGLAFGASFERTVSGGQTVLGDHRRTWQLRTSRESLRWERTYEQGDAVLGSSRGDGTRWTVGALHEWRVPNFAVAIGGAVGRDDSSHPLQRYFTARSGTVVVPGVYARAGSRYFGIEGGTMARHQCVEAPFFGVYVGAEESAILRLAAVARYTEWGDDTNLVPEAAAELHLGRYWISAGATMGGGSASVGIDLP